MPLHCRTTAVVAFCCVVVAVAEQAALAALTTGDSTAPRGEVGLRIPFSQPTASSAAVASAAKRIEVYPTFQWGIFNRAVFDSLLAAGLRFDSEPVDYRLTLGGETFDPAVGMPAFPPALTAVPNDGPAIRMIQVIGPTKAEWVDAMEAGGLRIVQYVHPFTYIVWGDANAMAAVGAASWVRWTGEFQPAFALLPGYRGMAGEIATRALMIEHADEQTLRAALKAAGAKDIAFGAASSGLVNVHLRIDAGRLAAVATMPGIYSVKPVPTDGGPRSEMSCLVNINSVDGTNRAVGDYLAWLNQVGLDGDGVIVANIEAGAHVTHPDLVARFVPCAGATCSGSSFFTDHGTHTAGIVAGDASSGVTDGFGFLRGLGVAPGASLLNQFWLPHYQNPGGMLAIIRDSYNNGASISGNAWGPAGSPQGYDDDTRQVDVGVRDADATAPGDQSIAYVLSIMNGFGGVSSQGSPDEGKNLIDVGSTWMQNNNGSQNLNINDLSSNSAHGPCLDGRKMPHLVAPGCNVDAPVPPSGYGTSDYWCGTSFASPQVSGGIALFVERYRMLPDYAGDPSPALIKAALLAVARSIQGNEDADGGSIGAPFDSEQGYGRFDLAAFVAPQEPVLYFDQVVVFDNTGESWSVDVMPGNPAAPMRIMLAWTDAPGHGLGGATPAWNNNLDLTVEVGAVMYRGNVIASGGFSAPGGVADPRNNTEAVFIGPSAPANATIRVAAANISSNGLPNSGDSTDQDFALACYNCVLTPAVTCNGARGDMTGADGVNGADIEGFLSCYLGGDPAASGCGCADTNASAAFEQEDIDLFVDCLLGAGCP